MFLSGCQASQLCYSRKSMEYQWKDSNNGKPRYMKKKTVPVLTLSATNPTWKGLGPNTVLGTESLTTNGLLFTAKFVACHFKLHVISGRKCYWSRDVCSRSANLYVFHQDRFIKSVMSVSETFPRPWRIYLIRLSHDRTLMFFVSQSQMLATSVPTSR